MHCEGEARLQCQSSSSLHMTMMCFQTKVQDVIRCVIPHCLNANALKHSWQAAAASCKRCKRQMIMIMMLDSGDRG